MNEPLIVTVTQVNRRLALMIKGDKVLQDVSVSGEISNFVNHYKTGHLYFTLKDKETSIKCVMFKWNTQSLNIDPCDGMKIVARGSIQVFERDGLYQLYVNSMTVDGIGNLYAAFEKLKIQLNNEGYFVQKRSLPAFPVRICIITSETGAALQDMLNILSRRFPIAKVVLIPSLVQGADAPQSIVKALEKAQEIDCDLIILGRGGGSIEDLWAFNDESVAKAIFASKIPTISAVGHETDFTIADFVADLRAPTPSAAAELAVPDINIYFSYINGIREELTKKITRKINNCELKTNSLLKSISAFSPVTKIKNADEKLNSYIQRTISAYKNLIERKSRELSAVLEMINALNPLNTLARGFAIAYHDDKVISDATVLNCGDNITVRLNRSVIVAEVKEIKNEF